MSLLLHIDELTTGTATPVRDLQLQSGAGDVPTVMGPSGSGKSSLLAAVVCTLPADAAFRGTVSLPGRRIDLLPTEQRQVGILCQDHRLFAHRTVAANLPFGVAPGPPAARRARAALMRALLADPQALLLGGPFSRLYTELRTRVRDFVFALVGKRRIPVPMVTHVADDVADPAHVTRLG